MKRHNQISVTVRSDNEADVYLHLPHFRFPKLLGTLYRNTRTFRTINRTHENLFHRFREGRPGLGVNIEVLTRLNFTYVEIPFNERILKTTREHFIENSVPSPFVSDRVDPQKVLPLDQFVVPEKAKKPEPDLFELKEAI